MQVDGIGETLGRIGGDRRPFDAAVGARQHARALLGGQDPHVLLRHHGLGEADQAAILGIVDIDDGRSCRHAGSPLVGLPSLPATLVITVGETASRSQTSCGMYCIMADVLAGIEVERHQRVRVEIVAGAQRAVEVGRRIADHEIDPIGVEIDRRVLPDAAAQRLVGVAGLGQRRLLGRDVAMQDPARGVLLGPDADRVLRGRVEAPDQLAGLGCRRP